MLVEALIGVVVRAKAYTRMGSHSGILDIRLKIGISSRTFIDWSEFTIGLRDFVIEIGFD